MPESLTQSGPSAAPIQLRSPSVADGNAILQLVRASGVLEPNTCYAYLLLSTHFADTCVVAEQGGELVGFVAAYRPPTNPAAVFVWQIGVSEKARGQGLGKRLLHYVADAPGCEGVRFLEATVSPSNEASRRLFTRFANDRGSRCDVGPGFAPADFGPTTHEEELLFRIGPFERTL